MHGGEGAEAAGAVEALDHLRVPPLSGRGGADTFPSEQTAGEGKGGDEVVELDAGFEAHDAPEHAVQGFVDEGGFDVPLRGVAGQADARAALPAAVVVVEGGGHVRGPMGGATGPSEGGDEAGVPVAVRARAAEVVQADDAEEEVAGAVLAPQEEADHDVREGPRAGRYVGAGVVPGRAQVAAGVDPAGAAAIACPEGEGRVSGGAQDPVGDRPGPPGPVPGAPRGRVGEAGNVDAAGAWHETGFFPGVLKSVGGAPQDCPSRRAAARPASLESSRGHCGRVNVGVQGAGAPATGRDVSGWMQAYWAGVWLTMFGVACLLERVVGGRTWSAAAGIAGVAFLATHIAGAAARAAYLFRKDVVSRGVRWYVWGLAFRTEEGLTPEQSEGVAGAGAVVGLGLAGVGFLLTQVEGWGTFGLALGGFNVALLVLLGFGAVTAQGRVA